MTEAKDSEEKRQSGPAGFEMVGDSSGVIAEALPVQMTFGTFVLSLSTSALVLLGEAREPGSDEENAPNLDLSEILDESTPPR